MAEQNSGLVTCCRYAYPPNSLQLCGPDAKIDLAFYSGNGSADLGTKEILRQFSTLSPYLSLIAYENSIADPFDARVVEAYWLGNSLLKKVPKRAYADHLKETIGLKKKIKSKELNFILNKFNFEALPIHAFHVLNIYKRTGHIEIPKTIQTMDACLINYGKVIDIQQGKIKVKTQRLKHDGKKLDLEKNIERIIGIQGTVDFEAKKLKTGDWVTYHWGILCQKITNRQLMNLKYFNNLSIRLANTH